MNFLDYIQTASPLIGGQVTKVLPRGSAFIENDIELPMTNGKIADSFYVPKHQASGLVKDAIVVFRWANPGQPGILLRSEKAAAPEACDVRIVEDSERRNATHSLSAIRRLILKLQKLLENNETLSAAINESTEILNDPSTAVATAISIYERARSLVADEQSAQQRLNELQQKLNGAKIRLAELHSLESRLTKEEERLAPLRAFAAAVCFQDLCPSQPVVDSSNVSLQQLDDALEGLTTPFARRATILSLLTASIQGRLLLLDGPVGVGKTTVAERLADACGGRCDVIPIRPAWVEPTDLLGFYDPLSRIFRPGPLTEAFMRPVMDRLNVVVLDEMNLARIENYAADLLSRVERVASSHQNGDLREGIPMWSPSEWQALKDEWEILDSADKQTPETAYRLTQLRHCFQYPPKLNLADGTVLVGTLNTDDTTYDLSPKVIDRSFAISFPTADLNEATNKLTGTSHGVSVKQLREVVSANSHSGRDRIWKQVLEVINEETMARLGIPYSYRVMRDFDSFTTIGAHLGASEDELLAMFIFARILPRIRFFKNAERQKAALDVLARVRKTTPSNPDRTWHSLLTRLENQCQNERTRIVRFWHGEPN